MAKKDEQKAKSNGASKGRLQIFVAGFAVEGGDSVLADGFKAIRDLTEAMKGSGVLLPPPRQKAALAASNTGGGSAPAVVDEDEEIEQGVVVETEDVEDDATEEETSNGNGSGAKRSYSFKTPTFMNELDVTKAKKNLKEFMTEKNPSDQMSKYLAVVYWLQKYMDIAEVKIDHVYTVFDILGWKSDMPSNPSIPLRDLKSKKHMLTRGTGHQPCRGRTFPAAKLRVRGGDRRRVRSLRSLHPGPNGPAFPRRPGESSRSLTSWGLRPRPRREFPRRPPSGRALSCCCNEKMSYELQRDCVTPYRLSNGH